MFLKTESSFNTRKECELMVLLRAITVSNYKFSDISKISKSDLDALESLVIKVGRVIIRHNMVKAGNILSIPAAQEKYVSIIKKMTHYFDGLPFIHYATQLVQYYLVWSEMENFQDYDFEGFQKFLTGKKILNSDKNLFIIEHEIATIFNELMVLEKNVLTGLSTPEWLQKKIIVLNLHLEKTRSIIDIAKIDAPYNVFVFYLGYAITHCSIKTLNILSSLNLDIRESPLITRLRYTYTESAQEDLKTIESITSDCLQLGGNHAQGLEFSFGYNFIEDLLEQRTEHVLVGSKL